MSDIEVKTIRRVMWRLLPFLLIAYCVAYLDRVNVGFAKLQMNQDLGLSEAAYGFGAGLFFISYFMAEVPSNLIMARVGARKWLGRIMITWGLVSVSFAFIGPIAKATGLTATSVFYSLRLLLGLAEAGFFPGIIYYFTLWFPGTYGSRAISLLMLGIPISAILGQPASGLLLNLDALSLAGWQWLFIIEAVPAVLIGLMSIVYLTDRPEQATWLANDEKTWLCARLDGERQQKVHRESVSMLKTLLDWRVALCAFVYFCETTGSFALTFFLPTIVKGFGVTNKVTGFVSAIPAMCAAIGMVFFARSSDRTMKRAEHVALAMLFASIGLIGAGSASHPAAVLTFLCIAQVGVWSTVPLLMPIPASFLSGVHAAAGLAAINSVGMLGGFFGPYIMGLLRDATGNFRTGLVGFGIGALVGSVGALILKRAIASNLGRLHD
jgi:MFS family permease